MKNLNRKLRQAEQLEARLQGVRRDIDREVQPKAHAIITHWISLVKKYHLQKQYPASTYTFQSISETSLTFAPNHFSTLPVLTLPSSLLNNSHWSDLLDNQLRLESEKLMWNMLSK